MEKWENIKDYNFSHFCLVFFFFLKISFLFSWKWKSGGMGKMSLYKFSHTPLLKNNGQLIQKVTNNQKKKKAITPFIKKKKILSQKKIMSS